MVGTTPLPLYVQTSNTDVPLTTGPVSYCPNAAFTTAADGHAFRAVEPDVPVVTEPPVLGPGAEPDDETVVADVGLPLDPQAAKNNAEQATSATVPPTDACLNSRTIREPNAVP